MATAKANTASASMTSTAFASSGAKAMHSTSRSRIITEETAHAPAETNYDCGASWRDSAHRVHGAHGNHRVSNGQGASPSRHLRDRARAAGYQRRCRSAVGEVLWHD